MTRAKCLTALICAAVALFGCQSRPAAVGDPPRACGPTEFKNAAGLPLPPADKPSNVPLSKSAPLNFANRIPVMGGVGDIGRWADAAPGWKSWRLWLRSDKAESLSVHLKPISLPARAELWLCSPDGSARHGPYAGAGPAGNGELWSPAVKGPELWLEVLAPAHSVGEVRLIIAEAFAAFR